MGSASQFSGTLENTNYDGDNNDQDDIDDGDKRDNDDAIEETFCQMTFRSHGIEEGLHYPNT